MAKQLILVTGVSGRIGSLVAKKFSGPEYQVVGFDIVEPKYKADNFAYIPMDLGSQEGVDNAFAQVRKQFGDRITSFIHLAAYYNFAGGKWEMYEKITIEGTRKVLKACQTFKTEQFIFSSTQLIYAPCELNQKINENWPLDASWEYPRSKIETEKVMREEHDKIPIVILQIAGCYDDECHSIPISNQIQRIYEKQFASRVFPGNITHGAPFLHLNDLVDVIWNAVQKRTQLGPELTVIVGEEETLSYDQLQRRISTLIFGKEIHTIRIPKWFAKMGAWIEDHTPFLPPSFIKPWMIDLADNNYILDCSRLKKTIGWNPKNSIQTTLLKMIDSLKNDPHQFYENNGLTPPRWFKSFEKGQ